MEAIRTVIYLKSALGPKPLKTCYFSLEELEKLEKDFQQYQVKGEPSFGCYSEEIGINGEGAILVEFSSIAFIKKQ
jgi:hypothetical protein